MREKNLKQIVLHVNRFYWASWVLLFAVSAVMPAQQRTLSTMLATPGLSGGLDLPKAAQTNITVHNIPLSQSYDHYLHNIPLSQNYDHYLHNISPVASKKTARTMTVNEKGRSAS